MTRDEWASLAERCEKATGPDREIDATIYMALRDDCPPHWKVVPQTGQVYAWNHPPPHAPGTGGVWANPTTYTASLEAITALIERELPGWMARVQWCGLSSEAWVAPDLNDPRCPTEFTSAPEIWHDYAERNEVEIRPGGRANAVLALCAAFCRAMASKEPTT